jgi:hypothetical protein
MTFPSKVERWRSIVQQVIGELMTRYPARQSLIDALGRTISQLEDTVLAIIQKESYGNNLAVGDSEYDGTHTDDSLGLMQLNYEVGTPQGEGYTGTPEGLFDPYTNIYYGTKYFLTQLARFKDWNTAIAAYNAGTPKYDEAGILRNQSYLDQVLNFLGEKKTSLPSLDSAPPSISSGHPPIGGTSGDVDTAGGIGTAAAADTTAGAVAGSSGGTATNAEAVRTTTEPGGRPGDTTGDGGRRSARIVVPAAIVALIGVIWYLWRC